MYFSYSWYGDYTMDVLLSTSLGASSEDMGEHGNLVNATSNCMIAQQTGSALNALTTRVLFCELTSAFSIGELLYSTFSKLSMAITICPNL